MSYHSLERQLEHEAEQLHSKVQADSREVVAYMLTIRSNLVAEGIEHTSADLVQLTKLALSMSWRPRRELPFSVD